MKCGQSLLEHWRVMYKFISNITNAGMSNNRFMIGFPCSLCLTEWEKLREVCDWLRKSFYSLGKGNTKIHPNKLKIHSCTPLKKKDLINVMNPILFLITLR